jgi:APA family basic amino acid/polyamine antiporter
MDKKALSLPILISLVVGNMIGTGIYVLPASLAEYGTISLVSWVFTSLGAIFLAITFANLSKRYPRTGGPYAYCREAYGHLAGFIVAYTYWISNLVSIAGIAVASISYLGFILPALNANNAAYDPYVLLFVEIATIWLFTLINIIGIHAAGVVRVFLTVIKLIPLFAITLVGAGYVQLENITQFNVAHESTWAAIGSAAALTFWAFIGLESATVPAENTRGYRDIYKATVFGTLITAIVYIASTFVLMGMIPATQLQNTQFPFAVAGTMLFGANAAFVIAIFAVISGFGALNACILVQGQIVFAAARDHLFPKRFSKLSKRDVPVAGQLLSSCIVTLFLVLTIEPTLLKQFNNIALLAALLTLLTYFATTLAEIKFLLKSKLPLHHLFYSKSLYIALLAAAYAMWMIASFSSTIIIVGIVLILICIPIYFFTIKNQALQ